MIKSNCIKKILPFVVLLGAFGFALSGCGSSSAEKSDGTAVQDEGTAAYYRILEEEHIGVSAAYDELSGMDLSDSESEAFARKLADLKKCEGRFAHESESTGNQYIAEVAFYLNKGKVFCSVPYTGYKGEIADGEVKESSDADYLFETRTTGNHSGQEQDFLLQFGENHLHISWEGTSDYVLRREDVSAETEQEAESHASFEETGTYKAVEALIDNIYGTTEHKLYYDTESGELNLYLKAPDSTKVFLTSGTASEEVLSSWDSVVTSMTEVGAQLYTVVHAGNHGDHVNIYMVDSLKPDNAYKAEDYLLWVDNDTVKFDIAEDEAFPADGNALSEQSSAFDIVAKYIKDNGDSAAIGSYSGSCIDITLSADMKNTCRMMLDEGDESHIIVFYSVPVTLEGTDDTVEMNLSLVKNNETADYQLRVPTSVNTDGRNMLHNIYAEGVLDCGEYKYHDPIEIKKFYSETMDHAEAYEGYFTKMPEQLMPAMVYTLEQSLKNLDPSVEMKDLGFRSLEAGPSFVQQ